VNIYKPCDIRGRAPGELSPELYRRWGRWLGRQVGPQQKFVVGGDVRATTGPLLEALIEGLAAGGLDLVNLGILPTPMIYYAHRRLRAAGCAIVTASHNAAQINGLKWTTGPDPPSPEDVEALRRAAEECETCTTTEDAPASPAPASRGPHAESRQHQHNASAPLAMAQAASRPLDVSFDYVAWLQQRWVVAMQAQVRVVIDPMHGCWAKRARRYLSAVFPHAIFTAIHDEPLPDFGGNTPDCARPENLEELGKAVYRQRAHLGVAFDGDGDRLALVDDEGIPLVAEEAAWVMLQTFGPELEGQGFVYDLKFSDQVAEAARRLGARPIVERSGHAFIRRRMRHSKALFGAELSGHFFYGELDGGDDGLFSACRLIAYLASSGWRLSELRRQCPRVYMTPDLRLPVPPDEQQQVIDRVRESWSAFPQQSIDGLRVDTPEGWALVRRSVTEPALTFRFESSSWQSLDRLVHRFCNALPDWGRRLWQTYRRAAGMSDGEG